MAETFGVEDRGHFYDPVGALRDVVVNHLMQVVAAAAMEAPVAPRPGHAQGRGQAALFHVGRAADPAHYVRGQYDGYRSIDGVAPDSTTETYAALRLDIENWRWAGVPFFIRTGKRLPVTQTELRARLQAPAAARLRRAAARRSANQLVVKLDPSTGIRLIVDAHRADASRPAPITLDMEFAEEGGEGPTPYEVLLHAAMVGDSTRFTRQDGVEEAWRVMQPLLDAPPPVHAYAPGIVGPGRGRRLVVGLRRAGTGPGSRVSAPRKESPMTRADKEPEAPQSAAAPSPFPPIADYAFLSDCHTGALVAPGRRDRLAVHPALRLAERVRQPARPRRPGSSASARSASPPDGARPTSRARTCSRRPGRRRRAGSSSATR